MIRTLIPLLAASLPTLASAQDAPGLDCLFTTICTPEVSCQPHDGLPFSFRREGDRLGFDTPDGPVFATPSPNIASPGLGLVFDTRPGATVVLTMSASGAAVMTQHEIGSAERPSAVTFVGRCAPATP